MNAKAIMALPGFGKSTMIVQRAKKGDVIVAMTSGAINSLKAKAINKNLTIMSL